MNKRCISPLTLMTTALLICLRADATEESLVFWAVNEGGARIYQPNQAACAKITRLSAQYVDGVSTKLGVPAYTLKINAIKTDDAQNSCSLLIDTPVGLKECALGSVIRTFGGEYLAHTYQQFADGRVSFMSAACH
jgi:hypothetical protein